MSHEIKLPKRAGSSKFLRKDTGPALEETLRYLIVLMRTDCDVAHIKSRTESGVRFQANEMGMEIRRFQRLTTHPHWIQVREIVEKHQSARTREKTFGHYVFKHLSEEAGKTWKELQFWADHEDGQTQIRKIMDGKGKKLRQELFIHALVSTHYDMSRALSLTGLPKTTLEHWRDDLQFAQLFDEIQWHKKNFFEKAMMDLVAERNPLATVWVNKTVNADRGYSEKIQVQHSLADAGWSFEDLDLDVETRRKVLEAIRKRQLVTANGIRQLAETVDVEEVEVEEVDED